MRRFGRRSDLARRGVVLDALGDHIAAAETFAAARIELDERGATFDLVPFDASYAPVVGWLDDHALRVRAKR